VRIVIDIDDTIAFAKNWWEYDKAKPIPGAKELLLKLMTEGHEVILWTARFEEDREVTEKWLRENGIPYHKLVLGKPQGDLYIGNNAIKFENWEQIGNELRKRGVIR